MADFIRQARENLSAFGVIDFDAIFWPVKGRNLRSSRTKSEKIWFTIQPDGYRTNHEGFPEPFASFVRAVIRHRDARRIGGMTVSDHSGMVRACRYLFDSLGVRSTDPTDLAPLDFNVAAAAAVKRELPKSAYLTGRKLQELAGTIDRLRLTAVTQNWVSPVPYPKGNDGSNRSRIGPDFDAQRAARLPSEEILDALSSISNADLAPPDLLRQRIVELLCCGGFRITELLLLPRDCWIEEQVREVGRLVVDSSGKPLVRCGIRYFPAKGGHTASQIKWLPTAMIDVARRAISDILQITDPFSQTARYLFENPGKIRLGHPWDSLDANTHLSTHEIGRLLRSDASNMHMAGLYFCKNRSIPFIEKERHNSLKSGKRRQYSYFSSIGDVRRALIECSSVTPVRRQDGTLHPLHTLLFVIPVNYFHARRSPFPGTATTVTDAHIYYYLNGAQGAAKSIFTRLGYRDGQGKELIVTSHQFRHWLNSMAQEGGLSQHEIARWMGRRRIDQNSAYDHVSGRQLARRVFEKVMSGNSEGAIARTASRLEPVRREEFLRSRMHTAHITDLGICIFDWAMMPCPKHGACATCDDHLIEKGNAIQQQTAKSLRDETATLVENAEAELPDGTYGVDNWLAHHRRTLERLDRILEIHANPSIQDGVLVQLDGQGNATALSQGGGHEAPSD